ncbi:MAG: DsrE/DsrF/DrsH-like family protein [Bacteroidales bacterium]
MSENKHKIKKVNIICAKGSIEDIYASLVMGNGAVMEGIEANLFFTFFGMEAIVKKWMKKPHTAVIGNPAMRMPGLGSRMPNLMGVIPGVEAMVSGMMRRQMDDLDVPPIDEFLDLYTAGGGKVYACHLAMDMFKLKKEDLTEHVSGILTVGEFYELAAGENSHIIFT